MSETKNVLNKYCRLILFIAVFAGVIALIVQNIGAFGNVLLVLLGFGAVVLVHEFGHFIFAKLSDIKVEAFSIGFPPVLVGILRTEDGFRVRVLPGILPVEQDDETDGSLFTFTIPRPGKAGETEYRIGLIPFGGFVKMLGQEDTKAAEANDNPRSYANKSILSRAAVIVAGVTFNAVSAVIIFMVVFLIGINLPPAIIGAVMPDSPAAKAGLKAGDEIIEINGKNHNLDFSNIRIAAALSDVNEPIKLKLRHEDGSEDEISIAAKKSAASEMRLFGLMPAQTLTIDKVSDVDKLVESIGLMPGDRIKAVDGRDVERHWQLAQIVKRSLLPEAVILAQRGDAERKEGFIETKIGLELNYADRYDAKLESQLCHIYSMVPRLKIAVVPTPEPSLRDKIISWLKNIGKEVDTADRTAGLQVGDIILSAGDAANPTYLELREVSKKHENKKLNVKVLRKGDDGSEEIVSVIVEPKRSDGRVVIGIGLALDAEHAVVAKTIGAGRLDIPSGACITAVGGAPVAAFYDVISRIRSTTAEQITIDYTAPDGKGGSVVFDAGDFAEHVTVNSGFAQFVPFAEMKKLYKADSPVGAIIMGYKKTEMFIAQTYVTIKRLVGRLLSPRLLIGPVGIIKLSYKIVAEQPLIYYVYFLGLINACIAVMNLLPMLPFDGGVLVLLAVEKIKGSPLNERLQGAITYASLALIVVFFLYVTFNDIFRSSF